MKVYISGPMSGYPGYNRDAFFDAAADLAALGHEPINPAEHPVRDDWEWADYIRADLRLLLDANAVAVLPGWECSRGAALEVHIAQQLGMPVLPLHQWAAS